MWTFTFFDKVKMTGWDARVLTTRTNSQYAWTRCANGTIQKSISKCYNCRTVNPVIPGNKDHKYAAPVRLNDADLMGCGCIWEEAAIEFCFFTYELEVLFGQANCANESAPKCLTFWMRRQILDFIRILMPGFIVKASFPASFGHLFSYGVREALLSKLVNNHKKAKAVNKLKTFEYLATVANNAVMASGPNAGLFLKDSVMAKEGERDSEDSKDDSDAAPLLKKPCSPTTKAARQAAKAARDAAEPSVKLKQPIKTPLAKKRKYTSKMKTVTKPSEGPHGDDDNTPGAGTAMAV
ncbi:hypothetical protein GMDG_05955 [Pseudogymnoascus destructans 20631-21]|uniref:Uncharacterized protein n=1 Tax=Pseudogymnoascus destructans (strain ATCC MYA-4855 / 20631-21) TaxID=658429 RepID=L8FQF8_PSED2|nr:hypothetical protein GMDG_05955 [Pseudogymnoascus destructans 20631-21]